MDLLCAGSDFARQVRFQHSLAESTVLHNMCLCSMINCEEEMPSRLFDVLGEVC